jgi:hypothetical protein
MKSLPRIRTCIRRIFLSSALNILVHGVNLDGLAVVHDDAASFPKMALGAGGVVLREGLMMALFGGSGFGKGIDESFIVTEGWALGTEQVRFQTVPTCCKALVH